MSKFDLRENKKGQVGETVSWIVATLIIVGVLIIFIYISVLMSKVKTIGIGDLKTDFDEKIIFDNKNNFAHTITNNLNKEKIDQILAENEEK